MTDHKNTDNNIIDRLLASDKLVITCDEPEVKDYTEIDYDQLDRLSERMDRLEELIKQASVGPHSADEVPAAAEPATAESAVIEQPVPEVSSVQEPEAAGLAEPAATESAVTELAAHAAEAASAKPAKPAKPDKASEPASAKPAKPAKPDKASEPAAAKPAKASKPAKPAKPAAAKNGRIGTMLVNFAAFYIAIMFWELFLYSRINGSLEGFTVWTALFAAAEAMVCTAIAGWIKNKVANRIGSTLVMFVVWFYYAAQLVYHRIFGSLFSMSMIGAAGNALTDFRWALISVLKQAWGMVLISLLPVMIYALATFLLRTHIRYGLGPHAAALVLAAVFWAAAALLLPSAGTDDTSAYYAYHSNLVDTDTAAARIGVLTNSLLETKVMAFGSPEEPEEEPSISFRVAADADDTDAMDLDLSPNTISAIDFRKLAEKANTNNLKTLCEYFAQDKGTAKNDYTGLFEGHNLIYICGEAFSSLALHEQVTPTLWKMAH